jgi:hypothetical protein
MEAAIISLNKNLKVLKAELLEETKELQDKFGKEKIKPVLAQEKVLQQQIKVKKTEIKQLINSAKNKLKSNSKFSDTKRQEREEKLESFFENIPTNPEEFKKSLENIKEGLSKKLTAEEINNLCQTNNELKQLRLSSQGQQTAQILQTNLPNLPNK